MATTPSLRKASLLSRLAQPIGNVVCAVLGAAVLSTFSAGCASTSYQVESKAPHARFDGVVMVFREKVPPSIRYKVIGEFVEQKQFYGGTAETVREVLSNAAAHGANAILIERSGHRVTGFSWASPYTEGKLLWIENYDAAAHASAGGASTPTAAQRLKDLDDLHRRGLVTDAEFEEKRKDLVDAL